MQVGVVYLEREIQSNIYCDQADSLQKVLANIIMFIIIKVYISSFLWWLIKKESRVIFPLRLFVGLKRAIEGSSRLWL